MKTTTFGALALCILLSGANSLTAQQRRGGLLGQLKDAATSATDQAPAGPAAQSATVATAANSATPADAPGNAEPAASPNQATPAAAQSGETASDGIDGTWKATAGGTELTLKTDGHKLTGQFRRLSVGPGVRATTEISDGTVNGNEISFKVEGRRALIYKGTLSGGELHMQVTVAGSSEQPAERTYVRAQ